MIGKKQQVLFVGLFFMMTIVANAQVTVFETYEDFKNKNGKIYDSFNGMTTTTTKVVLILRKDKKNKRIQCKEIWGFEYKKVLFRTDIVQNQFTKVINVGKVVYYENGNAHLDMLQQGSDESEFNSGAYCYLSRDLSSEMIPISGPIGIRGRKRMDKFRAENSDYEPLFKCIESDYRYQNIRVCVKDFEGIEE